MNLKLSEFLIYFKKMVEIKTIVIKSLIHLFI